MLSSVFLYGKIIFRKERKANNIMKTDLIYTGKAKDIYATSDANEIVSVYKDQATMLNGARKETVAGKGRLNNQISSLIFERLNKEGVATHFIKKLSDTEQLNKKVEIITLHYDKHYLHHLNHQAYLKVL